LLNGGEEEDCEKTVAAVMGMDADANMIRKAERQHADLPVQFFRGDVRNFTLQEPVDLVFSNAALHWIPVADVDGAVQCMARALKPGGRFVVEFGGRGNVQKIVEACRKVLRENYDTTVPNPWYFPSISEFTSVLERHGIEVVRAEIYDRPTALEEGSAGLRNWIRMFGGASGFLGGLHEKRHEEFLSAVEDTLKPDLWDGEQWTADYRRIRVVGQRVGVKQNLL
jgi:trans-aconitate methyltransferase